MSILFKDWRIEIKDELLARQYDNLSRTLLVTGDLPEGWDWYMQVRCDGHYDAISLTPMEGGVGAVLTENQLPFGGCKYEMQLKGVRGDTVRHTDVIQVEIPSSLSGTGNWPTIPSEFTQLEARMREIAANPPIPGENGYWQLYDPDTGAYADSQFPLPEGTGSGAAGADGGYYTPSVDAAGNLVWTASRAGMPDIPGANIMGPQGPAGEPGLAGPTGAAGEPGPAGAVGTTPNIQIGTVETLPAGSPATASMDGTPENPLLNLGIPQGKSGATPQRGVDYWTAEDVAEIKSYVDDAILGGAW